MTFEDIKLKFDEFVTVTQARREQSNVVAEKAVALEAAAADHDDAVVTEELLVEQEVSIEAELQSMFEEYTPGNG